MKPLKEDGRDNHRLIIGEHFSELLSEILDLDCLHHTDVCCSQMVTLIWVMVECLG